MEPAHKPNGLASQTLTRMVKATIFGCTNHDDALHLSKLRLCDNPSETYHVPNTIIPSLRRHSISHPERMNERLKQAKGLVYCTLWYVSIMMGYYFLYAPLLPLLIINRKWYRRATDVLYTIWESFNVVRTILFHARDVISHTSSKLDELLGRDLGIIL